MKKIIIYIIYQLTIITLFAQGTAQLFVHAPVLGKEDTLTLYLQEKRINEAFLNSYDKVISASNDAGVYRFEVPVLNKNTWLSINLNYQKRSTTPIFIIMDEFLMESRDSVHMYLSPKSGRYASIQDGYNDNIPMMKDNWDANFSGRGAAKYEALWKIKLLNEELRRSELAKELDGGEFDRLTILSQTHEESLSLLSLYKSKLSPENYKLLELQIKGQHGYQKGKTLASLNNYADKLNLEAMKSGLKKYNDEYIKQASLAIDSIQEVYAQSPAYMDYLHEYTWLVFADQYKEGGNLVKEWYELSKGLIKPSVVRDRILASILMNRFQKNPQTSLLEDALETMKDSLSISKVRLLESLLGGTEAYAFSLPDVNGVYHNMGDYKGKVVFMDFWYASCLACHNYMKNIVSPVKKAFKDNPNVFFITVSTDDFNTFQKMLGKGDFLPNDGVHLYTDGKKFKHPIIEHYQIRGYPFPLLIDKEGKLMTESFNLKTEKGLVKAIELALK